MEKTTIIFQVLLFVMPIDGKYYMPEQWMTYLGAIIASWIASVIAFPTIPFQQWLNSMLRSIWRCITFRSVGITGRWVAKYKMPRKTGSDELRIEIVNCHQLAGSEIRGSITDENTDGKYEFLGRIVFDELVAHYWSSDQSRDIGSFKFTIEPGNKILKGSLIVFDSVNKKDCPSVQYEWRRYPYSFMRFNKFRSGRSSIEGAGMFSNARFSIGGMLGKLRYGKSEEQGKYTISIKDKHYLVKKPWRFLNNSCSPNCCIEHKDNDVMLKAIVEIYPQDELTIDYNSLHEKVGNGFECRCKKCISSGDSVFIG